ncbi:MAG: hypothetical protein ACRD0U_15485, partial [Acidimicrobiales bacterium]
MSDLYPPLPVAPPLEPPPTLVEEPAPPAPRVRCGRPALVGALVGAAIGALVAAGTVIAFDDDPPAGPATAATPAGPSDTFAEA